jgi:hypothetical protein
MVVETGPLAAGTYHVDWFWVGDAPGPFPPPLASAVLVVGPPALVAAPLLGRYGIIIILLGVIGLARLTLHNRL